MSIRSIYALLVVILIGLRPEVGEAQIPGGCVRLLSLDGWVNVDSVMVDTCNGQIYSRTGFQIEFKYYILRTPIGPEDTVITRTWQDIDSAYAGLRSQLDSIEQRFGSYYFQKVQPVITDTSNGRSSIFAVIFSSYQHPDTILKYFRQYALVEVANFDCQCEQLAYVSADAGMDPRKSGNEVSTLTHTPEHFPRRFTVEALIGRCIQ